MFTQENQEPDWAEGTEPITEDTMGPILWEVMWEIWS